MLLATRLQQAGLVAEELQPEAVKLLVEKSEVRVLFASTLACVGSLVLTCMLSHLLSQGAVITDWSIYKCSHSMKTSLIQVWQLSESNF